MQAKLSCIFALICITRSFEPKFFELATINYGHLISSHPYIRQIEEEKMLHAMEHIGFMLITNHGISRTLLDDMWNVTQQFFNTSLQNKLSVPQTADYMYGYEDDEALGYTEKIAYFDKSNNTKYQIGVDRKEMFSAYIGSAEHPQHLNAVRWPPEPTEMRDIWIAYYRECERIGKQLLKSMSIILDLNDETYFDSFFDDHMSAIRALNYPAIDLEEMLEAEASDSWRCSSHSDYGTFTLLRQDGVGGLQVEVSTAEWMDVSSDEYDFIVNLGNTMKQWTNDRFKSTRHRVVVPRNEYEAQRRQSIAFFHNPNGNATIQTLKSCLNASGAASNYEPIKFLDLLTQLVDSRKGGIADKASKQEL